MLLMAICLSFELFIWDVAATEARLMVYPRHASRIRLNGRRNENEEVAWRTRTQDTAALAWNWLWAAD